MCTVLIALSVTKGSFASQVVPIVLSLLVEKHQSKIRNFSKENILVDTTLERHLIIILKVVAIEVRVQKHFFFYKSEVLQMLQFIVYHIVIM